MQSIYSASPLPDAQPGSLPRPIGLTGSYRPGALVSEAVQTAVYQHLQELLAQLPVAMYLVRGPAHVLDLVNLAAAAKWGCSPNQVRGQPFFEALPHLRGQGYEAAYATVWQTYQAVTWQEAPIICRPPGGPAGRGYFDVSFQPFYEEPGCLVGILVTSHDVTTQVLARQHTRQATEELSATNAGLADYVTELTRAAHTAQVYAEAQATLLAQLLEQAPMAIGLLVGADYVVRVCNPGLLALWGCTPAQMLHQPLFKVLPALQGQGLRNLLNEVSCTGIAAVVPLLPSTGEARALVACTFYPLRDAQGHTIAIAVIATVGEHEPA
ncbi:PAS domain-containing protein [Hymenobacter sp. HMF4947]|uniref:PAS domain-containing protein n=1 Tax=Hymenobacter ginkgonis TaxID=2682976 RepID=A0A7K1TKA3_9BACT|nr:PAS domain-containing protein [Hymenobacter ginkgonis]MVN78793.1 PAS domain-containing protein [Hymenobacter ginkgonis]